MPPSLVSPGNWSQEHEVQKFYADDVHYTVYLLQEHYPDLDSDMLSV